MYESWQFNANLAASERCSGFRKFFDIWSPVIYSYTACVVVALLTKFMLTTTAKYDVRSARVWYNDVFLWRTSMFYLRLINALVTLLLFWLVGDPPNNIGIDACYAATPNPRVTKKSKETYPVEVVEDSGVVLIVAYLTCSRSHLSWHARQRLATFRQEVTKSAECLCRPCVAPLETPSMRFHLSA